MAGLLHDLKDWNLDNDSNELGSSEDGPDKSGMFHEYQDGFCAEAQVSPSVFADDVYQYVVTNMGGSSQPGPCSSDPQWDKKKYSYNKLDKIQIKVTAYEAQEK